MLFGRAAWEQTHGEDGFIWQLTCRNIYTYIYIYFNTFGK